MTTTLNSERDRLRKYIQRDAALSLRQTAEIVTKPPKRPYMVFRYNQRTVLCLTTEPALYAIIGRRIYKLKLMNPSDPSDLTLPDKKRALQEPYLMRIAKELNITSEEAYELSQELAKADEAEFMSNFSEVAKERGVTLEEAYNQIMEETAKETEEFLFQIEKERITRMKELMRARKRGVIKNHLLLYL